MLILQFLTPWYFYAAAFFVSSKLNLFLLHYKLMKLLLWRHDTQPNNSRHNDIWHNNKMVLLTLTI